MAGGPWGSEQWLPTAKPTATGTSVRGIGDRDPEQNAALV